MPEIGPGVSHDLAKWRAAHYSDVQYKLNLTLEKMSPVLKGTIEIRVNLSEPPATSGGRAAQAETRPVGSVSSNVPIILDWRKIKGHENLSTVSNVSVNGTTVKNPVAIAPGSDTEHLIFREGVVLGENVIKLDFTSPILTSGSAVMRYIDKEDGSEYIYSLFVPSDASTAFPVFDQPDLKARFQLTTYTPDPWKAVSNTIGDFSSTKIGWTYTTFDETKPISTYVFAFAAGPWEKVSDQGAATKSEPSASADGENAANRDEVLSPGFSRQPPKGGTPNAVDAQTKSTDAQAKSTLPTGRVSARKIKAQLNEDYRKWANYDCCGIVTKEETKQRSPQTIIYVRKSQAEKFRSHAAEVFRLNREGIKYLEEYFDYKFPFPKYDIVLIPEFPFGGMEHAGATFLREDRVIFPTEPTMNDQITRANVIFHEAAHQWFGDTVTMKWFDDLWLKEGFAEFMAYKTLEHVMPETNAWKVFYERNKQAAYLTDSTKGTTPIYQKIDNLSAAKSAYGNIVYRKAPSFLRQAEFYIGEKEFQTAVRAFLKKHESANATWEDLVNEFEAASGRDLKEWAEFWVKRPGLMKVKITQTDLKTPTKRIPGFITLSPDWTIDFLIEDMPAEVKKPLMKGMLFSLGSYRSSVTKMGWQLPEMLPKGFKTAAYEQYFIFPNYKDYGYGIFLLDDKSREYVLKNIQNEKDPFLRSMMWGSLWDSVREGELDPEAYVELAVKVLSPGFSRQPPKGGTPNGENHPVTEAATPLLRKEGSLNGEDESTTALLLNRIGTALNYYVAEKDSTYGHAGMLAAPVIRARVEDMLVNGMIDAKTQGMRITYYRAFLNIAASDKARGVLKELLASVSSPHVSKGSTSSTSNVEPKSTLPTGRVSAFELKTKDKFDIVARLLILGDPDAEKLLAELEKNEPADDAKRYAYAARAGIATAENKAKYWKDFTENKDISESWLEDALRPFNSLEHSDATLPYLEKALNELPKLKRDRKIFFVNGWLGTFIGGQRSQKALDIINKFLADNPNLDNDLRLKILENSDLIERAVKIRAKFAK